MKKIGICSVIILIIMAAVNAIASTDIKVAVLPFSIFAPENYQYMRDDIPRTIENYLKKDGAEIYNTNWSTDLIYKNLSLSNLDDLRELGMEKAADYVIWGSLTWIGPKYSLDVNLLESYGDSPPVRLFVENQGLENLLGAVEKLSREISLKLFKKVTIEAIIVKGNRRIEADAIKRVIKSRPGDVLYPKSLSEDLNSVYGMGYFEDIRVESEDSEKGKTIIFRVKEKPTIRMVRIKGNSEIKEEDITDALTISTGSILNIFKVQDNITRIENLYKEKNFQNIRIEYNIEQLENNQADLEFIITEGEKVLIKSITFKGNNAFSSDELKKAMQTSEKTIFSDLTGSGELDPDALSQDVSRLTAYYHDRGYITARISDPEIEYKDEWVYIKGVEMDGETIPPRQYLEKTIFIVFKINEGPRFKVGKIDVQGDMIITKEKLMENLKISQEEYFSRSVLHRDIIAIGDLYADSGYAYADVKPKIDRNMETLEADATITIKKNRLVFFENIIITGNTKTRDKVIRRELKVYEQELYGGSRLKRSIRNLYRLDYFEDVKVNTTRGKSDDKMVLRLDVSEKPTGTFTFGAGYSNVEKLFGTASISQRNFMGRGQTLQVKGQMGDQTNKFSMSVLEPWLFDIPLSSGVDAYNWQTEYTSYTKDSYGGSLKLGYPIFDYTRLYVAYSYDISRITYDTATNTADTSTLPPDAIVNLAQDSNIVTSKISSTVRYDSRNRSFNPTEGLDSRITVSYAGGAYLGGDISYSKIIGESGFFIPLLWEATGFMHAKSGYIKAHPRWGELPIYERFNLGGINSLRGFKIGDLSPKDVYLNDIGGNKFVQFNCEILVPLIKQAGVIGLIFFDAGKVYDDNEKIHVDLFFDQLDRNELRESAGFGIRWYSPVGPIRLEKGYILDPKDGEDRNGRWEFTMGTAF